MRKLRIGFIFGAVLLLAAGCTKDGAGRIPPEPAAVSLEITLPAQTAVKSRTIDTDRENEVNRIDVFTFDDAGNLLPNVGHQTIRSFEQADDKLWVSIVADRDVPRQQFCAIANATDDMVRGITTKAEMEDIVFTSSAMPRYMFVMTGSTPVVTVGSDFTGIAFNLVRGVARFDVKLATGVTNFEIKSARVMNARSHAYAFQKMDAGRVTWPAHATLTDYARVEIPEAMAKGFTSRLYAYENYNGTPENMENSTVIVLGGIYDSSGEVTYYKITVRDNNDELHVIRNNRYDITINSVEGPGTSTEEDASISGDANIRFSIDSWRETDVNSEFDGTTSLRVSEREVHLPRDVSGGSIFVETSASAWTYDMPVDKSGKPVYWLTLRKDGDICNYMALSNASGAERSAYFNIRAGSKLKIRIKITQAYGDATILKLSSTGITAPSAGTGEIPISVEFEPLRGNVSWSIDPQIIKFGDDGGWLDFVFGQAMAGNGGGRVELKVQPLTEPGASRTGVVRITATDIETGVTENYKFTVTQAYVEPRLEVDRHYIASTATGVVFRLTVKSNIEWTASFRQGGDYSGVDESTAIADFVADESGAALPAAGDKTNLSYKHLGDGEMYVKFRNLPEGNMVRDGFIAFRLERGEPQNHYLSLVRMHQGDYRPIKINDIVVLDRNLGATHPGLATRDITPDETVYYRTYGYKYQWGRVPDGYEYQDNAGGVFLLDYLAGTMSCMPELGNNSTGVIDRSYYHIGEGMRWLRPDYSTPAEQRAIHKLWDADGRGGYDHTDEQNYTGMIENTNEMGRKTKFDPCPKGWRVPTARELSKIFTPGSGGFTAGAFDSRANSFGFWILKGDGEAFIPAAGGLVSRAGVLTEHYSQSSTVPSVSKHNECFLMSSSVGGDENSFWGLHGTASGQFAMKELKRHPYAHTSYMCGAMSVRCMQDIEGKY